MKAYKCDDCSGNPGMTDCPRCQGVRKLKLCPGCQTEKPADRRYFFKNIRECDGLHIYCKVCFYRKKNNADRRRFMAKMLAAQEAASPIVEAARREAGR